MKNDNALLLWIGRSRSFIVRYGIALLAFVLATAIHLLLDRILPTTVPFAFYFLAVLVAAVAGGAGPGIFTILLSSVTSWLLFVTRSFMIDISRLPRVEDLPSLEKLLAVFNDPALLRPAALANLAVFLLTSVLLLVGATAFRNAVIRRRVSERELEESERRFRAVADTMPQLVWSIRPDGRYDYYNQRCLEFAGGPPNEYGGAWQELIHPDDIERARETWRRALKSGGRYESELRLRGADGEYHWFLARAVPVRNSEGGIERWFGSSTDISDIVEARNALERMNERQEKLVADRTAELADANLRLRAEISERARAEEQLRHAHKMEALGQLTGGVAHDFNNLLTVVIGNIEALQRRLGKTGDPALREYAAFAMQGGKRAAALTQRLLAFARGQPLEPQPVDLNELLSGMSELLARTVGERVTMQTIFAEDLWTTEVDPNQFESVLLNLAANSRDAMPEGGEFTVETAKTSLDDKFTAHHSDVKSGDYVLVRVSDTGVGMDKDTLARVFEPFFTTKPVGQGTGLGLSQLYGFIKQSGGHVTLDSELGKGTTVKLYLPRSAVEKSALVPKLRELAPEPPKQDTVLVVEDDEDVRRYAVSMLHELGYCVIEAGDGAAALRQLEAHPEVRFLFSDVGLPGDYNGRELAEEAVRRRPYLKVLFTTGYGLDGIIHEGRLDAGVQLLTKPFTFEEFSEKVQKVFEMSRKNKILLVEDEAMIAMLTVENLRELGFEVEEAANATAALAAARKNISDFAAAVIDIGLPDRKGDDLALELKTLRPDLPIVIATGEGDGALDGKLKKIDNLTLLKKPYDSAGLDKSLKALGVDARA
ncbi:MAG TPA: response regulator [Xanthobacteraceae bacterium]|nr:response regulator [Xanthobacteraceae bacterium]